MEDKLELKDQSMWLLKDIKSVLQEVYDHYRSVKLRNDSLTEENERLKSENYKDEELSKLLGKYNEMRDSYYRGFPISLEEQKKIEDWKTDILNKYPTNTGAIGGRFTYQFTKTSIGVIGTIIDGVSQEKLTFQDLM